jgi:hypothetical protein
MSKDEAAKPDALGKPGRPTKFTPETQVEIVRIIKGGNYRCVAAEACGVAERTFAEWMAKGEEFPDSDFGKFRQAVIAAENHAEMGMVSAVNVGALTDPKHAEWWLERKFPDRWGRKERIELTGKDRGPVQVDLSAAGEDDLDALERLAIAARARASVPGKDSGGES